MGDAFIVAALRSPVTRRRGALAGIHPADLSAYLIRAAADAVPIDPAAVDDVIWGCVSQIGPQAFNIARTALLGAGLPESVPGTTVDRQCGSSQQAVHFAAHAIRAGDMDLVLAGGVELMTAVPLGSAAALAKRAGMAHPRDGQTWAERYGDQEISQFRGAELIADEWNISRTDMERFALRSHERAVAADAAGHFGAEIVPVAGAGHDTGPRPDSTLEKLAQLDPLVPGGRLTAATSSQVSDGAAALLLASQRAVDRFGLSPIARVHATAVVGSDPVRMLTGPIPATEAVLARAGLKLGDIGTFEVNEAFASVVLAWQRQLGADPQRVNPDGGAIALGHPLGATGARLMTSMIHRMRREGLRYGLQTMCEGGGTANATVVEAL